MSLRSGEVYSLTVCRKDGYLLMMLSFSGAGTGGGALGMTEDSRRLDVRERDEPRFDLEDRFLRYFMRLFISVMCSSLNF